RRLVRSHRRTRHDPFRAAVGERAQTEPSYEQRTRVIITFQPDRASRYRIRETHTPEPHRGERGEVGVDRQVHVEALVGEAELHAGWFDPQPERSSRTAEVEPHHGARTPQGANLHPPTDEPH